MDLCKILKNVQIMSLRPLLKVRYTFENPNLFGNLIKITYVEDLWDTF